MDGFTSPNMIEDKHLVDNALSFPRKILSWTTTLNPITLRSLNPNNRPLTPKP